MLVFDKFHIIKHLSEALDKVRREVARDLAKQQSNTLKSTRYILLKNKENLTDRQQARLSDLLKENLKSIKGYLLKEAFRKGGRLPVRCTQTGSEAPEWASLWTMAILIQGSMNG